MSHATRTAPELPGGNAFWLPLRAPVRLDIPEDWDKCGWRYVAAAAVPLGERHRAVVIGRYGGPEILDSELARLAHLAALTRTVASLSPEDE